MSGGHLSKVQQESQYMYLAFYISHLPVMGIDH